MPISCGGTVVQAGDIVVGDRDGVAVVPRAHAAEVLELVAGAHRDAKRRASREIRRAACSFKAEIDDTLRKKGVIE